MTRAGAEVVQAYVGNDPDAALTPLKTLQSFAKVALAPGEEKTITLALPVQAFSEWDDAQQAYVLPTGTKTVIVATSAAAADIITTLPVTLQGAAASTRPTQVPVWYRQPQGLPSLTDFTAMSGLTVTPVRTPQPGEYTPYNTPREMSRTSWAVRQVTDAIEKKLVGTTQPTSVEDRFMQTILLDTPIIRLAQQSSGSFPLPLVNRLVALANRHYTGLVTGHRW